MALIATSSRYPQIRPALEPDEAGTLLGCLRVGARPELVRFSRAFVGLALGTDVVGETIRESAEVIVSELVTNVVRHNDWDLDPVAVVAMSRIARTLRIEVHDSDPSLPKPQEAEEGAVSGRGLLVVESLSDRWGADSTPDGKFVWCELTAWPCETGDEQPWCDVERDDKNARTAQVSARATAWGAYKSITDAIRRKITEGEYETGSLLPSEAILTAEFGVSRNTLRRALADLGDEGLIKALPGRGRVVVSPDAPAGDEPDAHSQYRRIADDLRGQIERSELRPGDLVPSEAALVAQYGVSRGTARQALAELQGVGLIEAVHGKGRFVRERPDQDV
jgi:DNA-binding FadR family transcriptional regulator/anti-sigma regulatory factor (Ser/Thr protein kinase)